VTTSKELPSSNGHRATPGSTTQGFAKCLDCYSKYVKKYAPVCPQFQTTLFELTKKKPADEEDVCWYLREAMNKVKKTPPPNGENCERFRNWHMSLKKDFPDPSIFDGIEKTNIVFLTKAVEAIWETPSVWDDLQRKPPRLEGDSSSEKGEYRCGLLKGVQLAEEYARTYLKGKPSDEYGLGLNDIAAIHLYTQSKSDGSHCCLFKYLNAALRNTANEDKGTHQKHVRPYFEYIRLLQHALLKLPPAPASDTIFRAEKNSSSMEKNKAYFLELKRERKVFPYSEFSSCTEDIEAAEGYWGEEQTELWQKSGTPKKISFPYQGPRILYVITGGSSARNVEMYSAVKNDKEVLLPCATVFTIKSVIGINSGMIVVRMEQKMEQKSAQGGYRTTPMILTNNQHNIIDDDDDDL
jgi:hypothetical protein